MLKDKMLVQVTRDPKSEIERTDRDTIRSSFSQAGLHAVHG